MATMPPPASVDSDCLACRRPGGDLHSGAGARACRIAPANYETDQRAILGVLGAIAASCSSACRKSRTETTAEAAAAEILLTGRTRRARALPRSAHRRNRLRQADDARVRASCDSTILYAAAAELVPGLVPTSARDRRRSRREAKRQGWRRDRPGHLHRACSGRRGVRPRISVMPCCCPLEGVEDLLKDFSRSGVARPRTGAPRAARQGRPFRGGEPALPQRRGRLNSGDDGAGGRRRDPRSGLGNRGAPRRRGRSPEIPGQARLRRGHQPHASLPRQNPLPVVPRTRHGLRAQAAARRRRAGERCRTTCTAMASRSRGSPRSTRSRSAATARCCSPSTTCLPRATPS